MDKRMKFFRLLANIGFCVLLLFAVQTFHQSLPNHIYVKAGDEISYHFPVPVSIKKQEEYTPALVNKSESLIEEQIENGQETDVSYYVTCRLFGLIPVKEIAVTVIDGETVFAGGAQVGIYAKTRGVLVIGMGEVEDVEGQMKSPAKNLIKKGDYIVSVNGVLIRQKEELAKAIQESGSAIKIVGLYRDDVFMEVAIEPVCNANQKYMLGVWVRDDMAGIGTLTFYKDDLSYGALGHPVNDGDTGERILMQEGSLYSTEIVGIRRGENGTPGELSGVIYYSKDNYLGTVEENSERGIFGVLDGNLANLPDGTCYEIGYKQELMIGPATILSEVSGEVREYDIVIENINYSEAAINKGITLHVVDEELLEITGGIVQGMSGSPIIQDGKLVGAVTHVLVNDPTRGYGIFIETMLEP